MINLVGNNWDNLLQDEYNKDYFKKIVKFINKEYKEKTIFPPKDKILRALSLTSYDDVKVVILGQDPYHGIGEANGLSFAVSNGIKLPPSLKNIYKELYDDLGIKPSSFGNLECWAREGVLLLNAVLTVEKDKAASHKNIGWEYFTDAIIKKINEKSSPVVFILWGNFARSKKDLITNSKHLVIESSHPSPFSANYGFFGSKPFSKTNIFLRKNNIKEIDWRVY
ncbi:MAG: uracil-DNA glycosylase [Bacilli bacterium]|nr:uracil-DNA glycosylase [Bacilli bacterium]